MYKTCPALRGPSAFSRKGSWAWLGGLTGRMLAAYYYGWMDVRMYLL